MIFKLLMVGAIHVSGNGHRKKPNPKNENMKTSTF